MTSTDNTPEAPTYRDGDKVLIRATVSELYPGRTYPGRGSVVRVRIDEREGGSRYTYMPAESVTPDPEADAALAEAPTFTEGQRVTIDADAVLAVSAPLAHYLETPGPWTGTIDDPEPDKDGDVCVQIGDYDGDVVRRYVRAEYVHPLDETEPAVEAGADELARVRDDLAIARRHLEQVRDERTSAFDERDHAIAKRDQAHATLEDLTAHLDRARSSLTIEHGRATQQLRSAARAYAHDGRPDSLRTLTHATGRADAYERALAVLPTTEDDQ